eukprot:4888177-Prorocentrum_lima.AAC.1
MTSSLVGSEMCIRDRTKTSHQPFRTPPAVVVAPAPFPTVEPLQVWASAVSYTHLTLPTICSV